MGSKHNSVDSDKWIQWIEDGISKCYLNYYEYNEFQNIKRIGSGAFGNVYRANWESSNTVVALKSFRNDSCIIEIVNEVKKKIYNNILCIEIIIGFIYFSFPLFFFSYNYYI
jgi:serine/threonine protein kinase